MLNFFILFLFLAIYAMANGSKTLGVSEADPASSCNEIYQRNPASRGTIDQYWIKTNEGLFNVTCNMKLKCGGVEGGWMQIADIDSNRDGSCPETWYNITTPKPLCLGNTTGCNTAHFTVSGISYAHICGQAKAYQKGVTGAFHSRVQTVKGTYVDGISIALASPHTHVWTYAVGYSTNVRSNSHNCPCAFHPGSPPPAFVGNDYYCDSGSTWAADQTFYYLYNPLWDGDECYNSHGCCSTSGLPWFYKRLPLPVAKKFEVSICKSVSHEVGDIGVEKLEIFVI